MVACISKRKEAYSRASATWTNLRVLVNSPYICNNGRLAHRKRTIQSQYCNETRWFDILCSEMMKIPVTQKFCLNYKCMYANLQLWRLTIAGCSSIWFLWTVLYLCTVAVGILQMWTPGKGSKQRFYPETSSPLLKDT